MTDVQEQSPELRTQGAGAIQCVQKLKKYLKPLISPLCFVGFTILWYACIKALSLAEFYNFCDNTNFGDIRYTSDCCDTDRQIDQVLYFNTQLQHQLLLILSNTICAFNNFI